jgi:Ca2+-binding RTX toxin-like protein
LTDAQVETLAREGVATAIAEAGATIFHDPAFSSLFTKSSGFGEKGAFEGSAKSETQVIASFLVEAGQTFSFDFLAQLELNAKEIENPNTEHNEAISKNAFLLLDTSDLNNVRVLDYFGLQGELNSSERIVDLGFGGNLGFGGSSNVTLTSLKQTTNIDGDDEEDSLTAFVTGTYQQAFSNSTGLTLVEINESAIQFAGDPSIGKLGEDVIYGTIWDDELYGTGKEDKIYGSLGNDYLYGRGKKDTLEGGPGDDLLNGGKQKDKLHGGSGNDALYGEDDRDEMYGGEGNDTLYGGDEGDTLIGGLGNDELIDGPGNDSLIGVDPTLVNPGVGEVDLLQGKAGSDIFVLGDADGAYYDDGNDATQGLEDYAWIGDFQVNESDRIQLHGDIGDYSLGSSPERLPKGTAIFLNQDGHGELIGIIEGINHEDLSLASNAFSFL